MLVVGKIQQVGVPRSFQDQLYSQPLVVLQEQTERVVQVHLHQEQQVDLLPVSQVLQAVVQGVLMVVVVVLLVGTGTEP